MKALFHGIAISAAAGLLMGGLMQYAARPGAEVPEGPQMLVSGASVRSLEGGDYGASLTSYNGQVPDYVVGTDWLAPVSYEMAAYDEPPAAEEPAPSQPVEIVYASAEPPPEAISEPDGLDEMNARIAADGETAANRIAHRSS